MKKLLWLGVGIAIGAYTVRKVSAGKAMIGPDGLNRAVGKLGDSIAEFADAIREGMGERESDLRSALGVDNAKDAAIGIELRGAGRRAR